MKNLLLVASLILAGCGTASFVSADMERLAGLTADELKAADFFLSSGIEFISLKKGEIVGEDIFKYEKKKTFLIEPDIAGHIVANGPGWLNVEFPPGIILRFTWDPVERAYLTPGWGTTTIAGERFDMKQGVLSGRVVRLMIRSAL